MSTRIFLLGILVVTLNSTVAQIGAKANPGHSIVGLWSCEDYGIEMVLQLNQDKTGAFDESPLTYSVNEKSLTIKAEGSEVTYFFELQANQLILSGGDLDSKVTFIRKTQDIMVGHANSSAATQELYQKEDYSIIGSWSGGGEVLEFRSGGQCIVSGEVVTYQYTPPWIELTGPGGSIKMETTFTDADHINLNVNGNLVTYTRTNGTTGITDQKNSSTGSNDGQIDMSLVGKWCSTNVNTYNQGSSYSSTCITLNADGTYLYTSESERDVNTAEVWAGTNSQGNDSGKWWMQGDRIFYNSPTTGQGSYRLEKKNHPKNVNDPMIVLDGTPYVTAYAKTPW